MKWKEILLVLDSKMSYLLNLFEKGLNKNYYYSLFLYISRITQLIQQKIEKFDEINTKRKQIKLVSFSNENNIQNEVLYR